MFFMVDFFEALEKRVCIASATDGLRASSQVAGHHASGDPSRCDGASKRSIKGPFGTKGHKGHTEQGIGRMCAEETCPSWK